MCAPSVRNLNICSIHSDGLLTFCTAKFGRRAFFKTDDALQHVIGETAINMLFFRFAGICPGVVILRGKLEKIPAAERFEIERKYATPPPGLSSETIKVYPPHKAHSPFCFCRSLRPFHASIRASDHLPLSLHYNNRSFLSPPASFSANQGCSILRLDLSPLYI